MTYLSTVALDVYYRYMPLYGIPDESEIGSKRSEAKSRNPVPKNSCTSGSVHPPMNLGLCNERRVSGQKQDNSRIAVPLPHEDRQ